MRSLHQPVTMGSPRSTTVDTGTFWITEAWFPSGSRLEPHSHERGIVAVMLGGSFETHIARRELICAPETVWTEPCEERHANYVGTGGAHVLVMQPDPRRAQLRPFTRLMTEVVVARDPMVVADARRLAAELAAPDSLTPLVLESIVVLILARTGRLLEPTARQRGIPDWLKRAREMIHDTSPGTLRMETIADTAGVTQWHLAREFRRHFLASIGEYARALRLNRALEQLAAGRAPISEVALAAGFADQSHLTRACKGATGLPPAAYRARMRGAGGVN